jgi:hypothetical protein
MKFFGERMLGGNVSFDTNVERGTAFTIDLLL